MPRRRKTIAVDDVRKIANRMLADSVDSAGEGREAVAVLIERVLMDTGNYKGYRHLPGVMDYGTDPPNRIGDETRRAYYGQHYSD